MSARTIGKLAREAGVGVETIRFYERRGLIPRPRRPAEGYRTYPEEARRELVFIRRAKGLGFTLAEIKDMLRVFRGRGATCGEVSDRAGGKLEQVRARIRELRAIERALEKARAACLACPPESHCPVLEHFPFDGCEDGTACIPNRDGRSGRRPPPTRKGGSS